MPSHAHHNPSRLRELIDLVRRFTEAAPGASPYETVIDGVSILRSDSAIQPSQCMLKPALCMTLQGKKAATFGATLHHYGAGHGLVVTVEMPERGTVWAAGKTRPYLGLVLGLDLQVLQEFVEAGAAGAETTSKVKVAGPFTLQLNDALIDCALRAIQLLSTPDAITALYPGIMRELCYWLLKAPGGRQLERIMLLSNSQDHRVMKAIKMIRVRFREHVHVEELAHVAYMSLSTFHRQFKMITSITPLQYQKQLRLFEARRLLISDNVTVERAAFEVGYASVSQFSREYVRTFGSPPRREISASRSRQRTDGTT